MAKNGEPIRSTLIENMLQCMWHNGRGHRGRQKMRTDSSLPGGAATRQEPEGRCSNNENMLVRAPRQSFGHLFACGMCVPNGGCCDLAIKESGWYHYWPHGISV